MKRGIAGGTAATGLTFPCYSFSLCVLYFEIKVHSNDSPADTKAETTQSSLRSTATNEAFWVIRAEVAVVGEPRTNTHRLDDRCFCNCTVWNLEKNKQLITKGVRGWGVGGYMSLSGDGEHVTLCHRVYVTVNNRKYWWKGNGENWKYGNCHEDSYLNLYRENNRTFKIGGPCPMNPSFFQTVLCQL